MLARTHNPMPVSQSWFVPLETLPGSRRGGASFCVPRREGSRDRQGVRGVRNLRQGRDQTGGARSPISRSGGRCAVPGGASTPGRKGRPGRTARFGLRGRRRPTLSGLPDAQGLVLAGRRWAENPAAALLVLNHCTPREAAKLFGELGGMNPSSSCALVRRAVSGRKESGRPWTREAETGEAVCCLARRGSAPPRRGRRSMPGVLRDGQFPERGRQKTLSFGPEAGKATAQLTEEIAHVRKVRPELVADADAAPDNWTFLEKLRPDEQAVDFFHAISARFPTVASNWYEKYRAARRRRRQGRAISATRRRRNRRFSGANSGFSASTDAACVTRTSRPTAARSGVVRQQGPGQPAHETGALEHEVRMSSPSLVGPSGMATGAANEAPDAA